MRKGSGVALFVISTIPWSDLAPAGEQLKALFRDVLAREARALRGAVALARRRDCASRKNANSDRTIGRDRS
jgi:hypothetical protein